MKKVIVFIILLSLIVCDDNSTNSRSGKLAYIEIVPVELNIEIDSTYQFSAIGKDINDNIVDDIDFIWISTDSSVGIVDSNGIFTAFILGTTSISVRSDTIESPQATVNVFDPITSIKIQQDTLMVDIGSTSHFTAIGLDNSDNERCGLSVIWETGNINIATIDSNGIVTGISRGEVKVTAQLRDKKSTPSILIVGEPSSNTTITDIDGNIYETIIIGDQCWLAENLKVTHYRNGDSLPNVSDISEWGNLTIGSYCVFGNDLSNISTRGCLYNWYAINDNRDIAPEGWHVPTDNDWKELEMYLGMNQTQVNLEGKRGTDEGNKLKTTSLWYNEGNGTDDYDFSGLPGGCRSIDGSYNYYSSSAYFWSSTDFDFVSAWSRCLVYFNSSIYRIKCGKIDGQSIRLIKDN